MGQKKTRQQKQLGLDWKKFENTNPDLTEMQHIRLDVWWRRKKRRRNSQSTQSSRLPSRFIIIIIAIFFLLLLNLDNERNYIRIIIIEIIKQAFGYY